MRVLASHGFTPRDGHIELGRTEGMDHQRPPGSSAERYRHRAAELRGLAMKATDPVSKQEFENMARQYEALADNVRGGGA